MGPKTKFTKEQIIDVAFDIAQNEGLQNITIRKVAEKLGSSVAPVYVNFTDGSELLSAVVQKAQTIAIEMTKEDYTENHFLNIGIGNLRFAREYSILFRSLAFMEQDCFGSPLQHNADMRTQMRKDHYLDTFSDEELDELLLKMSIFTHGLASMAAYHLLPSEYDNKALIKLLSETGSDIIASLIMKKEGKSLCK